MATKFDPQAIAARIAQNAHDVDAGRITWEEFSARNNAAWREADRGELCIMGSAADRRVMAVHRALQQIK